MITLLELTKEDRALIEPHAGPNAVGVTVDFDKGGASAKQAIQATFRDKLQSVDAIVGLVHRDNAACFRMCAEVGDYEAIETPVGILVIFRKGSVR